ncbi:class I SAM-dependent methyltransferase [Candidatus Dojkabacteria bacterium]|uniref:Class I SAM-dependent methyltransferase n=1 Tax=Candidatus Dojkabacteria bacterium TaxID=2099670 RepID=A0A955IBY5_9BACT|nr:class I SAM-dependent methyltransferase [Candidatus Dojkabacteria bacterium]
MIDTFQRYLYVYNYIKKISEGKKSFNVLDVGPNGPGLARYISEFPNVRLTLLETDEYKFLKEDIEAYPEVDFVNYDGERSKFKDSTFDLVTCIDTFEHVPPQNRETFIKELARVAKNDIIMSFPLDHAEPFEKILRMMFLNKIKFLDEHKLYGQPNEDDFKKFLKSNKVRLIETDNNLNVYLWIPVKLFSSVLYRVVEHRKAMSFKMFKVYAKGFHRVLTYGKPYSKTFLLSKK